MRVQNIVLADSYGITTHKRGTRQQVVHQGFILELALEASGVAQSIPRLYAYERSLFAVWTPESDNGCLIVHRHCGLTIGIHQHRTMRLTLMNLHRVIAEEVVTKFQEYPYQPPKESPPCRCYRQHSSSESPSVPHCPA